MSRVCIQTVGYTFKISRVLIQAVGYAFKISRVLIQDVDPSFSLCVCVCVCEVGWLPVVQVFVAALRCQSCFCIKTIQSEAEASDVILQSRWLFLLHIVCCIVWFKVLQAAASWRLTEPRKECFVP